MDLKDGQDWTVVKFKKYEKKPHIQRDYDGKKGLDDDDGGYEVKHISREKSKEITKLRLKHKLSQKDLAQKLNMSEHEIKEMENGHMVSNNKHISKVLNYLKRLT